MVSGVDQRARILNVAEKLLDSSADRDISTRAVCDAAGIGAPMLYRLFGDKNGLLQALVDHGYERYLAGKRAARRSDDPVADLRAGWDSHVRFALAHPAVYRLMYSPGFAAVPDAANEALRLLKEVLRRCAAEGDLRLDVDAAAQAIMSANIGVALSLITQPDTYTDQHLSARVRDALHRALLTEAAFKPRPARPAEARATAVKATARQLDALLEAPPADLTPAETTLLREWLRRLRDPDR